MPPTPLDDATIRELEPFLLRLAGRAVRDAVLAHDIVQATFLSLIEPTSTYDASRGVVRSYLAGVLMRKVADHFRRQRRERVTADLDETTDSLDERLAFDPSRAMHPIDRSRAMSVIDQALARLPYQQRLVVLACDVEQMDRAEAASSLGITEGNLRVLLHRARHELRKALEDAKMR
jgi:RNA polymerase sigma-70 factor (ECF subfamily)